MTEYRCEKLARSLAGHDKGQIYLLLAEAEETVTLVNGTTKPLSKPKRKNRKHIQLITHLSDELLQLMQAVRTDTEVKYILKQYQQRDTRSCKE